MTKSDADFSLDAEMQKDIDVQILLCSNSTSIYVLPFNMCLQMQIFLLFSAFPNDLQNTEREECVLKNPIKYMVTFQAQDYVFYGFSEKYVLPISFAKFHRIFPLA